MGNLQRLLPAVVTCVSQLDRLRDRVSPAGRWVDRALRLADPEHGAAQSSAPGGGCAGGVAVEPAAARIDGHRRAQRRRHDRPAVADALAAPAAALVSGAAGVGVGCPCQAHRRDCNAGCWAVARAPLWVAARHRTGHGSVSGRSAVVVGAICAVRRLGQPATHVDRARGLPGEFAVAHPVPVSEHSARLARRVGAAAHGTASHCAICGWGHADVTVDAGFPSAALAGSRPYRTGATTGCYGAQWRW